MVYCPGTDGDVFDVFGLFETQPKENDIMPTAGVIWELIERTRCASCGIRCSSEAEVVLATTERMEKVFQNQANP
jgi:hypothetical protein